MFVCICDVIEAAYSIEIRTSAYQTIRTTRRKRRDKWVPVTTACSVPRLGMKGWPQIWRVVANILNKQLPTADMGWSSSLGVGEVLTTPHRKIVSCYESFTKKVGPGLIRWYDQSNEKGL